MGINSVVAAWRGVAILLLGEGRMNSENEIKQGLLAVCKVKGWDGDFNILGFHALCDKLKQLGADDEREAWEHKYARLQGLMEIRETQPNKPCCLAEREACAKVCDVEEETANQETWYQCAKELAKQIRARGNT